MQHTSVRSLQPTASATIASSPRFDDKQQVIDIDDRIAIDIFNADASAPGSDDSKHIVDTHAAIGCDIVGAQLAQFIAAKIRP
jgi:hypothetical protein